MDENRINDEDIVQLSRLALTGRQQDIRMFILRLSRKLRATVPEVASQLASLVQDGITRHSLLRGEVLANIPVDADSRLHLLRHEFPPLLAQPPIFPPEVCGMIDRIVLEHNQTAELMREGLSPTRTTIFTGPPGVGKTMTARWLADRLQRPLLTIDLSAVMSSFLGRTGANVRHVLDFAKGVPCVMLLDELDAIAKRRDDAHEVGELKRLVTVLLQEIDDWPAGGLLVAATNHPELLDPAVWRRFETCIEFPLPGKDLLCESVARYVGDTDELQPWAPVLAVLFSGRSYCDIERNLTACRRESLVTHTPLTDTIHSLVRRQAESLSTSNKRELAKKLSETGLSQRQVSEVTGVSRDFLRKWSNEK